MSVFCPKCKRFETSFVVYGSETSHFRCEDCQETFTSDDVKELIDAGEKWKKVLAWCEQAPKE